MWCWGCDVRHDDGNLLITYGAEKRSSPNPRFHSAYTFKVGQQSILNLWGWGIWIAHPSQGSLFISRSRFRVTYSATPTLKPQAWQVHDLPPMRGIRSESQSEAAYVLLATALHWISSYERWLWEQVKPTYREQAIASWPQRRRYKGGVPAEEMADRWFELAEQIQ